MLVYIVVNSNNNVVIRHNWVVIRVDHVVLQIGFNALKKLHIYRNTSTSKIKIELAGILPTCFLP